VHTLIVVNFLVRVAIGCKFFRGIDLDRDVCGTLYSPTPRQGSKEDDEEGTLTLEELTVPFFGRSLSENEKLSLVLCIPSAEPRIIFLALSVASKELVYTARLND
jgi:hypothetical protein